MGKRERKFDEVLILRYKESKDEHEFEKILADSNIRKYLYKVCSQKLRNSPTTLYSIEDFINISYLVIWQSIHKFRFICPCCKLQAKSESAYKLHTVLKHDKQMDPDISITRYIKFNLGAYLQNEVRREYSLERKSNVLPINIFSPADVIDEESPFETRNDKMQHQLVSDEIFEDQVIFKDTVANLLKCFDQQTKEIFLYIYMEGMQQHDIAEILYNQGRYSSTQSASVVISRTVKLKINPVVSALYSSL